MPRAEASARLVEENQQALRMQVAQINPNELPAAIAELEGLGRPMTPALVLARERASSLAEGLSHEIENASSESNLLELLRDRPVSGFQLCLGLSKLAKQVSVAAS